MTVFSVEHIEGIDLTPPNDASILKKLTGGMKVAKKGSIPHTPKVLKEVVPHLFCKRCHGATRDVSKPILKNLCVPRF